MKRSFLKPFEPFLPLIAVCVFAIPSMLPSNAMSVESKTLSVKMANTPIFSQPSMDSEKTATVQAGDLLEEIEEAGRFYKVKTPKGEIGYVPRMNVRESEPAQAVTEKVEKEEAELDEMVGALGEKQAFKLDEASSSHSVRGKMAAKPLPVISPEEAEKSVEAMESFVVTPEEVLGFRKEGGLDTAE